MADEGRAVEGVLDEIDGVARRQDRVTFGNVVDALDHRGFAPFLIVLPLLELSPVGGIPGVPTLLAGVIALIAAQIALGREELWMPRALCRLGIASGRLGKASEKMRPVARRLDRWFHGRLCALTRKWVLRVAGGVVLLLCLTVPPLELLPFASSAPMATIALFGLAMLFHDGAMMLLALVASAASMLVPFLLF